MPDFNEGFGTEYTSRGLANRLPYPNPFYDLSRLFIPKNIKSLFRFCRIFYYTFEYIGNVVNKLSEYPVTDIQVIDQNLEIKAKWDKYLNKHVHVKRLLQEFGLDYNVFGNCIVSANSRFTRFLKCSLCGVETKMSTPNFTWKYQNFKFHGFCPSCNVNADFKIKDAYMRNQESLKFIRWAPESIIVKFDPYLNESRYFYQVPANIERGIRVGDKVLLETVPEVFMEAVKQKKAIELDRNNIFHFKRPTLAEEDMGFGKPLILSAMKKLYYMQTLQRANEAIAVEHIIPKMVMFPMAAPNLDVYSGMNIGNWRGQMEEQVLRWRRDPNYIAIMPVQIGYEQLGGDGKNMLLSQELKFHQETVIQSLGVPLEFVQGGASWTGSSISMRLISNYFLNYRELLHDFLNDFLVPKSIALANMPKIEELKLQKFRMIDDPAYQQLLINLNVANKISDDYLLTELNIDKTAAGKSQMNELKGMGAQILEESAKIQARAAGEGLVIQARYQARAMWEQQQETLQLMEQPFAVELAQEMVQVMGDITVNEDNVSNTLQKLAISISMQDPEQQSKNLLTLQEKTPTIYMFVMQRLQNLQTIQENPGMLMQPQAQGASTSNSKTGNNLNGKPATTNKPGGNGGTAKPPTKGAVA